MTPDQPSLVRENLLLRPIGPTDSARICELAGHREIAANTTRIPHPYTEEDAREWIGAQYEEFKRGEQLNFAIIVRSSGELIGLCGLSRINREYESAEIGYWIGRQYWNRGHATGAVTALVDYAFRILGLNRVYSRYMRRNPASGRVLAKCGFVHEGTLRQHVKKWGKFEDIEMAAILKEDYLRND